MVHVPDWQAATEWYQRAFPHAIRRSADDDEFGCLQVGEVMIEIVAADAKVTSGAAGSVVYWRVESLDDALAHFRGVGATLYRGPLAIERGERMCQVQDPWGNCIGLRGP